MVEAEDKAALDADAARLQGSNQVVITQRLVEALPDAPEGRLVARLEPDQQVDTPAADHDVQQFGVPEAVGRDQAAPLLSKRGDGGEKLPGVFGVIDDAHVIEGEVPALDAANVAHQDRKSTRLNSS